jgi:hypothetical protein
MSRRPVKGRPARQKGAGRDDRGDGLDGGRGDDVADGRDRVAAWFQGRIEEKPRRRGPKPAQPIPMDYDPSGEFLGAAHELVLAPMQRDPGVRWPGMADERNEAAGFEQGLRGVNLAFVDPIVLEDHEPEDVDLSRFRSW